MFDPTPNSGLSDKLGFLVCVCVVEKQLEALLTVWGGIINQAPIMANDSSAFQSPGEWGVLIGGILPQEIVVTYWRESLKVNGQ